jgi:endonuclease-3
MVTRRLFQKAPTPEAILALGEEHLQSEIRECGLFRNKARNITETCQILLAEHGGVIPSEFADLIRLPGVGRKTANVVLSNALNTPAFPVDTHVFRVSNRIGLATGRNPREVEEGWKVLLDEDDWYDAHHLLIQHGRTVCKARGPRCDECQIRDLCAIGKSLASV